MKALTMAADGIDGRELGIVGECQYALAAGQIYRRPASHAGSYGGWRWECAQDHPGRYPSLPHMSELAALIAAAARADDPWARTFRNVTGRELREPGA
jgi:hypothetical protein